jgi:hypothetical protein
MQQYIVEDFLPDNTASMLSIFCTHNFTKIQIPVSGGPTTAAIFFLIKIF